MRASSSTLVTVRPYVPADEARVLELLDASLGASPAGAFSPDFFRWKHFRNPWGPSVMLVAEQGDALAGYRALMRWRFQTGGETLEAVRPVDTATHPDFRGRGIFSRLTKDALTCVPAGTALVFNTPNDKSGPGYLKMGWTVAGRLAVQVRVRRPLRLSAALLAGRGQVPASWPERRGGHRPRWAQDGPVAERAADALLDEEAVARLLDRLAGPNERRIETARTVPYLRWRYAEAPLDYRAVRIIRDGELAGLALFRVRPRGTLLEATVAEVLVGGGDERVARSLLRAVVRAAPVDHLACALPSGTTASHAALRCGFVPSPAGVTLATRTLAPLDPDPGTVRSWALSLGDVEVF